MKELTVRAWLSAFVLIAVSGAAFAQQTAPPAARPPASSTEAQRERWNRIFSEPRPNIRTEANEFVVRVASELKPGAALDIGMGVGRNALFLARRGWKVTGVDLSDTAVQKAKEEAEAAKLPLTAVREDMFAFDYGTDRYDLVVFTYMGGEAQGMADKITAALKPGGLLVIEHFLRQEGMTLGYPAGVLPTLYPKLEVLRYAEEEGNPDYDQQVKGKVVRLLARKKP